MVAGEPRDLPGANPAGGLPSDDPVLSGAAARRFFDEMSRTLRDGDRARDLLTGQLTQTLEGLREELGSMRGQGPAPSDQRPRTTAPPTTEPAFPPEAEPERPRYQSFSEGRGLGAARASDLRGTMGSLTRSAAGRASTRIQSSTSRWQVDEYTDSATQFDADGNILQQISRVSENPEIQDQIAQDERRFGQRQVVAAALSRFGAGEGVLGALGGTAARLAGPVGVAVGVGGVVGNRIADQTAEATAFRRVYGEDAGRFAITQRFDRRLAGIEGFFTGVGSDRAQAGYDQMMELGLSGAQLDRAVDFDREQYLRTGLGPQESARLVALSRRTGSGLESLSDSLERVAEAAVAAGRNAAEMQGQFIGLAETLATQVSNTPAAERTAQNLVSTFARELPTGLVESTTQALGGLAGSTMNQMLYAASTGQDFRALSNQVALGTGDAITRVTSGSLALAVDTACKVGGTTREQVAADVQAMFGSEALTPAQMEQVLARYPNLNALTITQVFQTFGIAYSAPSDAISLFFEEISGLSGKLTGSAADQGGGSSAVIPGGFEALGSTSAERGYGLYDVLGVSDSTQFDSGVRTFLAYGEAARASGDRNQVVESLLKVGSTSRQDIEDFSGKNLDETKFRTPEGEMTLPEILGDEKLAANLASYSVVGKNKNDALSVGQVTGFDDSAVTSTGSDMATSGGFTLGLTPEARQFFQISGPSVSQRSGVPAAATVAPNSYGR